MPARTIITAHSGCENTPPNSREFIEKAFDVRCEMLEIDINRGAHIVKFDSVETPRAISFRAKLNIVE